MTIIASALRDHGVRPVDAALRLGISKGHLGDLLSGRRAPSPELALKVEQEFGIPAESLNRDVGLIRASTSPTKAHAA